MPDGGSDDTHSAIHERFLSTIAAMTSRVFGCAARLDHVRAEAAARCDCVAFLRIPRELVSEA
jgi:hypothetical protein